MDQELDEVDKTHNSALASFSTLFLGSALANPSLSAINAAPPPLFFPYFPFSYSFSLLSSTSPVRYNSIRVGRLSTC